MRMPDTSAHVQQFLYDDFIFVKIFHHLLNGILFPLVKKRCYMWEGLHVKWEGLGVEVSQGLHMDIEASSSGTHSMKWSTGREAWLGEGLTLYLSH